MIRCGAGAARDGLLTKITCDLPRPLGKLFGKAARPARAYYSPLCHQLTWQHVDLHLADVRPKDEARFSIAAVQRCSRI